MVEKNRNIIAVGDLEIVARPCQSEDIGFVYELMYHNMGDFFNKYAKEGWSRQKFKQGFTPERITLFEHEEMPVGFLDVELNERVAYWHNIQLSEDYRRRNIGLRLVDFLEEKAFREGVSRIKGKVFKENRFLNVLTRRMSYDIIQEIPEENSVLVEKHLGAKNE
jgi:GNAT superfamily N-acetyltransferase